ncbi:MAG TPA: TrkA family potassium uptake protein [Terriglobales bacterium]|nr:TrkA family potassium uptake protein [Terriglobales bacterium]
MKSFAVIGLGRFGSNLAKTLSDLGFEVLGIDEKPEAVARVCDDITHAVTGDAKEEHVLQSLGIRNFDCVIVAMSTDMQSSILVTLMLKEMGVREVVAKASSDLHARVLQKVGADKVVFPERDMGARLAQSLSMNSILEYIELSDRYSIVEIMLPDKWEGRTLREIGVRSAYNVNVIALRRTADGDLNIAPDPDEKLLRGDVLIVIGESEAISRVSKL